MKIVNDSMTLTTVAGEDVSMADKSLIQRELLNAAIERTVKARPVMSLAHEEEEVGKNGLSSGNLHTLIDPDSFDLTEVQDKYGFKDSASYSIKTHCWQGYVVDINQNTFTAKLEGLKGNSGTYEIGEFEISEVSPDDKELLCTGAIFYLSVGSVMQNGQLKKESILRFKRAVNWTLTDFDSAVDLADRLSKNISWD